MDPIYLDYNATTPIDPEVAKAMKPFLEHYFGNPSSIHQYGITSKMAIEQARGQVARLVNARTDEIVFTSGGTESNNFALKGIAARYNGKGNHIITSAIEHPAVLNVCRYLEKNGFQISYIPVDGLGMIDLNSLKKSIKPETILISIMHANNEVGTIQPIGEIAGIAKKHGIIFHSDAAQSAGKISIDIEELTVDLLSIAGHKLYGPKGVGALYIRSGIEMENLMHGADHENNRRAGTENVLEIVGLGKACEMAFENLQENSRLMAESRNYLYDLISSGIPKAKRNGHPEKMLPNTLSMSFPGVPADLILSAMPEVAASAGAACHSDQQIISHVLDAMGLDEEISMGTIRFSTGKNTTRKEIKIAADRIINTMQQLGVKNTDNNAIEKPQDKIKLTQFTHGLGCACKLRRKDLEQVIDRLPEFSNKQVLIDASKSDDAAVYQLDESTAIIQSVDFITPVVDDPSDFGSIAAANALSDIYAMGGKPIFALNIAAFPSNRLPLEVLQDIMAGANSVLKKAGIQVLGGHTIEDTEPKFGMVVNGLAHPEKILTNQNARPGDAIILTKPIGTGIITTAIKRDLADEQTTREVIRLMKQLNKDAAETASQFEVNSCTDITGFGLLIHLFEMLKASGVSAEIDHQLVPLIKGAAELARLDIIPGGSQNNMDYSIHFTTWGKNIPDHYKILLNDAQTSGGLLYSLPEQYSDAFIEELMKKKLAAKKIGKVTRSARPQISVL